MIPDGVTEIGEGAFDAIDGLQSITIPRSVALIGDYAFGWDYNENKIPGFVVKVCCDTKKTAAQTFAEKNGISFELIHNLNEGSVIGEDSKTSTVKHVCKNCGEIVIMTYDKKAAPVQTDTKKTTEKNANPIKVKAKKPTVKYSKLKKKNQTISRKKAITVSKAQGTVTYKLSSAKKGKKSYKKYFKVSKSGKITVKKKLKKGTYKVKIKVTAAGNSTYKAATKTVTVSIKVK